MSCFLLSTFLQWFGCCTVSIILLSKENNTEQFLKAGVSFTGCSLNVFSAPPWVRGPASLPAACRGSVIWTGAGWRVEAPPEGAGLSHLGDGSGTAAPGV